MNNREVALTAGGAVATVGYSLRNQIYEILVDAMGAASDEARQMLRREAQRMAEQGSEIGRNIIQYVWSNGGRVSGEMGERIRGISESARNSISEGTDLDGGRGTIRSRDRARLDARENMEMIEDGNAQTEATRIAAAGGGGGPSAVSKETQISSYPNVEYGLAETFTGVFPWTGWVSAATLDKDAPVQLRMRMNTPIDMVDATLVANPAAGSPITKGLFRNPLTPNGVGENTFYPTVLSAHATTGVAEQPQWWNFYKQFYQWWTVLGCEYKIVIHNPSYVNLYQTVATLDGVPGHREPYRIKSGIVIAEQIDTYSGTAGTTGNIAPVGALFEEWKAFKNIKWHSVEGSGTTIISGTYKPGQAKRNIVNDGDVKTWTAVAGGVQPNLNEFLTLNFWQDPMNNTLAANLVGCNIEINLKYIIQLKDLHLQARYPTTSVALQPVIVNLNDNTNAVGNPLQKWG